MESCISAKKVAAPTEHSIHGEKPSPQGCMITPIPQKPTRIAVQRMRPTRSLRTNCDSAAMISGAAKKMEMVVVTGR